ncbi:MAG: diguanylate cyclase [Nitrospiraceae bacterium]|nr:diguanylate cyclase [Nitrospiraceae bacterium]
MDAGKVKKEKILIADDVPANIKMLGEILKGGYEIVVATNGHKAYKLACECAPDLILMDVMMPEMDGFTACGLLKAVEKTADIPVIFITASRTEEDIVKGFTAGGVDYITKPFNPTELDARVRTHLELRNSREILKRYSRELESKNNELNEKNVLLGEALEQITCLARTDHLTGLCNRSHMMEKLREEEVRFHRNGRPFSLILSDIDHFKRFNDTYGHECGDLVLKTISGILKNSLREQDTVARWGGEEFLLLLPETDVSAAEGVARRLLEKVASHELDYNGSALCVTMTFGVSAYEKDSGIAGSIRHADEALYDGKEQGRNRVVGFADPEV